MKTACYILVAAACIAAGSLPPGAEDGPLRLAVDLVDGSRVIGTSRNDSIRLQTVFGNTQISLRAVERVRWKQDREHIELDFPNGDRLTGAVIPEPVQLTTLFGDVKISMEHIAMLKTLPSGLTAIPSLDGLLLHFAFNDQPKAGVFASRVEPLFGKVLGGRWVREGQRGGAFQLTKGDDGLVVADHELLRPRQLTLAAWVNPDANSSAASSWRGIVTKSTSGSWSKGYGLARYPSSPDVHFYVNYYSGETAHAPIPDNEWTHVSATYDGQTMHLYVNGKLASSTTPQSYGGPILYDNSPLLIGQGPNGYGWFGMIDEVMLFNRVLSAEDISRLYQLTRKD
jgi:hypothetical protein